MVTTPERSLPDNDNVFKDTLKGLTCLTAEKVHLPMTDDYVRVFGPYTFWKELCRDLRNKFPGLDGLDCDSTCYCRYIQKDDYLFERGNLKPHKDEAGFKGARIGIHVSTDAKKLHLVSVGTATDKKTYTQFKEFILDRNGIYIMNGNCRYKDETSLFHMGSCKGVSVTTVIDFNRDFKKEHCELIAPKLIAYAERLYSMFVANLPTTSNGSSKTRRIKGT